jgi:type VI protein secretion system component VasK
MRSSSFVTLVTIGLLTMLLCLGSAIGYAAESAVTPELEAKAQRVRDQKAQQPTQAQRDASAAALKAQKEKIKKAKESQTQPAPAEKSSE